MMYSWKVRGIASIMHDFNRQQAFFGLIREWSKGLQVNVSHTKS